MLSTCTVWQGLDISAAMLDVAKEREVEGDLCHHDLGDGLPFRPGMFDGAISISAVQWLCNAVCCRPHTQPVQLDVLVNTSCIATYQYASSRSFAQQQQDALDVEGHLRPSFPLRLACC